MVHATSRAPLQLRNPAGLVDPSAFGYTHLAEVAAGTRMVFLAGQGGHDAAGALTADFAGQVRQALLNVSIALESVGARPNDIVRTTLLIVDHDIDKLMTFGVELSRTWGASVRPPSTLIPVPRLALEGMLFEIEVTAIVRG